MRWLSSSLKLANSCISRHLFLPAQGSELTHRKVKFTDGQPSRDEVEGHLKEHQPCISMGMTGIRFPCPSRALCYMSHLQKMRERDVTTEIYHHHKLVPQIT